LLDLDKKMEKCDTDLLLADDSTKHALGRIDNIMIELHMKFVPVDFIVMDMESKTSGPIILGTPLLRKTGASLIPKKEMSSLNSHIRSVWNIFQGRRLWFRGTSVLMTLAHHEEIRYEA
jgi:hypothetical protein